MVTPNGELRARLGRNAWDTGEMLLGGPELTVKPMDANSEPRHTGWWPLWLCEGGALMDLRAWVLPAFVLDGPR